MLCFAFSDLCFVLCALGLVFCGLGVLSFVYVLCAAVVFVDPTPHPFPLVRMWQANIIGEKLHSTHLHLPEKRLRLKRGNAELGPDWCKQVFRTNRILVFLRFVPFFLLAPAPPNTMLTRRQR